MDKNIKKSTNIKVKRASMPSPGVAKTASSKPKYVQALDEIHKEIRRIYKHIFDGGTIDQIDHEDMIILILNPPVKEGSFSRKSYGTLYTRNVIYINKVTGEIVFRHPGHWGNIDLEEVDERLKEMERYRLT